jgi:cytochrome c553
MHKTGVIRIAAGIACIAAVAQASEPGTGEKIATTVCAACHGANGISVANTIPNLAGQRAPYIQKHLNAFKSKKRLHSLMNGLAAELSQTDIKNLAAYFEALPSAPIGTPDSNPPENFVSRRIRFPANLAGFTLYKTFNKTGSKELRKIYANKIAIDAARVGKPIPDGSVLLLEKFQAKLNQDKQPAVNSSGLYVAAGRIGYNVMERQVGWGKDFSPIIRNDNWQYRAFEADGSPRARTNQAGCLACHKPHRATSYMFTLEELRARALK